MRRNLRLLGRVVAAAVFVVAFNIAAFNLLLASTPALGAAIGIVMGGLFLLWHLGGRHRGRRQVQVRFRPPKATGGWLAAAIGASLVTLWGVTGLIGFADPPMDPDAMRGWEPLVEYVHGPGGWIAAGILMVLVVPMVEEFCFRGWIQRSLERRWGPAPAILMATLLFTLGHADRPHWSILLVPMTLGLLNGTTAWLARSIWPAVATHSLWNLAMLSTELAPGEDVLPVSDQVAPLAILAVSLAFLALGLAGWAWLLRGGRAKGRAGGGTT